MTQNTDTSCYLANPAKGYAAPALKTVDVSTRSLIASSGGEIFIAYTEEEQEGY